MAVLAVRGYAGACCGRVLARKPAHTRPRSRLAPPRRAPHPPDASVLRHMGIRQRQRVGVVRGVPYSWYVRDFFRSVTLRLSICPYLPVTFFFIYLSLM